MSDVEGQRQWVVLPGMEGLLKLVAEYIDPFTEEHQFVGDTVSPSVPSQRRWRPGLGET